MSDQSYPADAGAEIYLLTVQGTPTSGSGANARDLHNATAGNPAGVAGAKALGDLSHNVFLPEDAGGSADNRLLFLDTWNSPNGVGIFFSDPRVIEGGAALFAEREAVLWMPAAGFGGYTLPVPSGRSVASIGLLRAPVSSPGAAQAAFHADSASKINAARQAGQVAHTLWVPAPVPGATPALEVLGLDCWLDAIRMNDWYANADYAALAPAFAGAPVTSTWMSAGSDWVEW
jgi:hypothetical protein